MSLAVRIIPCLDVRGGRVVKGINFKDIVDAGDPAEAAKRYDAEGADEICMLDIDASFEERSTTIETVKSIASQVFIPFTVGGGIKSLKDIDMLLKSGADKVSINTSAILKPDLIAEASKEYGAQCIVLAIDAKQNGENWNVYTHGGKNKTDLEIAKTFIQKDKIEKKIHNKRLEFDEFQNLKLERTNRNLKKN